MNQNQNDVTTPKQQCCPVCGEATPEGDLCRQCLRDEIYDEMDEE